MSLEEIDSGDEGIIGGAALEGTRGRGETKARKGQSSSSLLRVGKERGDKLGLKKMEGINRVVLRRPKNVLFVIPHPEVYKSPASDCYIVFGEAKVEDAATQGFGAQSMSGAGGIGGASAETEKIDRVKAEEKRKERLLKASGEAEEEGEEEQGDVADEDIELVVGQAGCSRSKGLSDCVSIKALKSTGGDIVQAILELA
ncbi:nascent polypeptide-associated complex subunit alpha, partial [Phenoliferia sp. Uapishka_3]